MPRVVLYDVDGTLISHSTLGAKYRTLFFPKQTLHTFREHIRKGDHIIVASSQSSRDEIITVLTTAGLNSEELVSIEILGGRQTRALPGDFSETKKVNKVKLEMQKRNCAGIIVEDSLYINARDENIIHILVPTEMPERKPYSAGYLQTALLPISILKEKIKPKVEHVKSVKPENDLRYLSIKHILDLSNLYHRFTNLFKVPTSYQKMCRLYPEHSIWEKSEYGIGIAILNDYCKNEANAFAITGIFNRFFTGHWNRNHTDAVQKLLDKQPENTFSPLIHLASRRDENNTINSLLQNLKVNLIEAGKPLNPTGSLARRIEFIQSKLGICVIDIDNLNDVIKTNSAHKYNRVRDDNQQIKQVDLNNTNDVEVGVVGENRPNF